MNSIELTEYLRLNHPSSPASSVRRKLSFGVGVNDADYIVCPTLPGGKISCPAYSSWRNMLMRVFSDAYRAKQPTYAGCSVCSEWLSFMTYRSWWLLNYKQDFHLDKDFITPGNKHYSPDNCIFIPQWLSAIVSGHDAKRGDNPIGVIFDKRYGTFAARIGNGRRGSKTFVGNFKTKEDAAEAYATAKLNLLKQLKPDIDRIDTRLYKGIVACVKIRTNPL